MKSIMSKVQQETKDLHLSKHFEEWHKIISDNQQLLYQKSTDEDGFIHYFDYYINQSWLMFIGGYHIAKHIEA